MSPITGAARGASLVAALLWMSGVASAAPLGASSGDEPAEAVIVTVSGGVSLGAYEAGALYVLGEVFKRDTPRRQVVLATGASAGSVNALTTALSACMPPNPDPRADLGWQVWTDVGFDALYNEGEVTATHVFSDRALKDAAMRLAPVWEAGLPEGCDVVVGATATRVDPRPLAVGGLGLRRETERFVFRIRGAGHGAPPRVDNYVDPAAPLPEPRLPFVADDGGANFAHLRSLFLASAAFPVAFPPQTLAYCLARPGERAPQRCAADDAETAAFIDGGVFDNSPLRLAYRVGARGLDLPDGAAPRWRDLDTEAGAPGLPDGAHIVYVNPSRTLLPDPPTVATAAPTAAPSLLAMLGQKLGDFVETARSRELFALFEERPEVADLILATSRRFPTASGHLAAFLGFFERDLRVFDFYLGMYDAYHELGAARVRAGWIPDDPAAMPTSWRPFACLLAVFDGEGSLRPTCDGDDLANFRALAQVALDRVYARCERLPAAARPPTRELPHCARAADGAAPPRVIPAAGDGFRRDGDESDLAHTFRLLADYGFAWRDLGLAADDADDALVTIRRRLLAAAEALAGAQDDMTARALVLTAGRMGVNSLTYEPPANFGYAVFGTHVEVGASLQPLVDSAWFRLNVAASVDGLWSRITNADDEPLSIDLTAGPELSLLFLTSPFIQPTLGVRAGYRFSSADDFLTSPCAAGGDPIDSRHCSQFVVHTTLAATFVERVRLQLTFELTPLETAGEHHLLGLQLGIGLVAF